MKIILEDIDYKEFESILCEFHLSYMTKNMMNQLFNRFDDPLKGDIYSWGFYDTPTREKIGEYVIENILGLNGWDEYNKLPCDYQVPFINLCEIFKK